MTLPFPLTPNACVLAPLAGVADRAMRELCMETEPSGKPQDSRAGLGAAFCCGEMVSAMGIYCGDRKSRELMALQDAEQPCGLQLFGREPHTFPKAVEEALKYHPAFLDINMGCPAHKVAGHGSGAALMKSPVLAEEITKTVVRAVAGAVPVSVKMRAGWDGNSRNAVEIAQRCEAAGAAWITVHGRTRGQMYAPPVDLAIIKAVKEAVSIPVIGNGDVTDGPSAAAMLSETGCDAVMIGRAAQGRPWIFRCVAAYLKDGTIVPELSTEERMATMLRHVRLLCEYKGEYIGMREARKHAAWYTKGLRGAAALRQKVVSLKTYEELEAVAVECMAMELSP